MFKGKEILNVIDGALLTNSTNNDFSVSAIVTDSRKNCSEALFVALTGDNFDGHEYLNQAVESGAAALCISAKFAETSNVPDAVPVVIVENTLLAYQTLAKSHREKMNCTVIGVTGSSGKTSTKEILKTILVHSFGIDAILATEGNTNNHIGVPQNLLKLNDKHRFAVIEMGTNHPGEIEVLAKTALPDVSIISSIGNAHIEFFGNTDGVALEKSAIFAGYPNSSGNIKIPIAVFPAFGEGDKVLREKAEAKSYTFGAYGSENDKTIDLFYEYLGGNFKGSKFRLSDKSDTHMWSQSIQWPLQGSHQASNAAAAALAALAVGVSERDIEKAFQKCSLPGMRMCITEKDGVTWINDAYNANPDSVRVTLDWLAECTDFSDLKIVLGDMLETGASASLFHSQILHYALDKLPKSKIYGVGKEMNNTVAASPELQKKITCFSDSEVASYHLKKLIKSGDTVFLKGSRGIKLEKISPLNY